MPERKTLVHIFPRGRRVEDACQLGVSLRHLNGVAQGRRPVSPDLAARIIRAAPGLVSLEELFQVTFPEGTPVHRHEVVQLHPELALMSPATLTPPPAVPAKECA